MQIKKILTGFTAVTVLMGSLVSCGTEKESRSDSNSETSITSAVPETNIKVEEILETENETEEAEEGTTSTAITVAEETTADSEEVVTSETSEKETSGDSADETSVVEADEESQEEMTEEKAIALTKEAVNAWLRLDEGHREKNLSDTDINEFIRTNNSVLFIWCSSGEIYSEEEIRNMLIEEKDLLISDPNIEVSESNIDFGFNENMEWEKAEELSEEQVLEWKDTLTAMVSEISKVNVSENKGMFDFENIESVWGVYAVPKDKATDFSSNIIDRSAPIFLITKYNGEWKVDLISPLLTQAYLALSTPSTNINPE